MDIYDPITGIKYDIRSKKGRKILKKYIKTFKQLGGANRLNKQIDRTNLKIKLT